VNLEFVGLTFEVVGSVLLGITILLVHRKIMKEKSIDKKVIREIHFEQIIGITGIIFIVIGYLVRVLI